MYQKIEIGLCPEVFQTGVKEKTEYYNRGHSGGCQILNVSVCKSTPYMDKSCMVHTYRALLLIGNMFVVLRYSDNGLGIYEDSIILGEIMDILEHAPSWTGLPSIQPYVEGTPRITEGGVSLAERRTLKDNLRNCCTNDCA